MRSAIFIISVLTLIGLGFCILMMWPDHTDAQGVKIERGTRSSPTSDSPTFKTKAPPRTAPVIEMVYVRGGSFLMGSPEGESKHGVNGLKEYPQHKVTVPSFYIGKYEVTQAQWRAVMGFNPSDFTGSKLPVVRVSWKQAKMFCSRLSQMTGKKYRLPTEAEWEYACRAGTTGDFAGSLDAMAWYINNSGRQYLDGDKGNISYPDLLEKYGSQTHPVGQKQPNAFGIYDMHGNVSEWTEDTSQEDYVGAPTNGSAWVNVREREHRIHRGGAWNEMGRDCRCASRNSLDEHIDEFVGLRVAISARTP